MKVDPIRRAIDALNVAMAAASPAPWGTGDGYEQSKRGTFVYDGAGGIVAAEQDRTDCVLRPEDATFMVLARNLLPQLFDRLRALEDAAPALLIRGVPPGETSPLDGGGNFSNVLTNAEITPDAVVEAIAGLKAQSESNEPIAGWLPGDPVPPPGWKP